VPRAKLSVGVWVRHRQGTGSAVGLHDALFVATAAVNRACKEGLNQGRLPSARCIRRTTALRVAKRTTGARTDAQGGEPGASVQAHSPAWLLAVSDR
jgi:hypothetical protein